MTTPDEVPGNGGVPATPRARVLLDSDGLITEWSEGAEALLGYGPEEMVSRPLWSLLVRPDPAAEPAGPDAPPAGDDRLVLLRDRAGRPVETTWHMYPRLTPEGPLTWVVLLARADAADPGDFDCAVLDALLTEAPIGLHLFDTDLRLVRFNTASPGMRHVRPEDVIGQRGAVVAPRLVTGDLEELLRHVLDTGQPLIDFVQQGYPPADLGHEHVFSMSAFRLCDRSEQVLGAGPSPST
ncbi:PAS domain-containing protein [Streptomyces sp. NPDC047079]|uniref:PAS domain-containing protein n=1 Tax=Streptomyces sp. NPDC047079 TaxID=3154607 RepID=UPI00340B784C